jgi:hypothetical protein
LTTEITQAGITYAVNARNNQGPKINIIYAKIGPTQVPPGPPSPNDPSTDITDSVYTASPGQLQYAVVDANTVEYILTLDESVGNFTVGRIGLFTDDNTLFSITMIDAKDANLNYVPDFKFKTAGTVVGNRLVYSIYLAISSLATISNFTIQLLQLLTIPEVASELLLPDPTLVAFNTYQLDKHSFMRTPAIGLRQTATQGRTNPSWLMAAERLIPGQGEGVVPIDPSFFAPNATVGSVVYIDSSSGKVWLADPQITNFMIGIRSSNEEVTNYGVYVDNINNYSSAFTLLYAGSGVSAGQIVTAPNNWCIGYTIGPVNSQPAGSQPIVGWLCWVDFTGGLFARKSTPTGFGATGATGATGPGGGPGGGGGGFQVGGQCYLELLGGLLVLHPYNGNSIIIDGQVQIVPSSGITLPSTGLSPDTNYYIYAFMSQTGMALEASTTGHITSQITGVEIKNLDQSRTLVGFARTVGSSWADQDGLLCVLSWFNRKRKRSRTILPKLASNAANDYVEVSSALRNYFLIWGNQLARFSTGGSHLANGGNGVTSAISIDGNYPESENSTASQGSRGPNMEGPIALTGTRKGLLEGLHYSTLMGFLSGGGPGTAYWRPYDYSNTHNVSNPLPSPITITMVVDG